MTTPTDKSHVLVTAIGGDRPGIVEQIAGWLLEHGGNIEDSRMSQLGGEFAAIILTSGPASLGENLESAIDEFRAKSGLHVTTKSVSASPPAPSNPVLRYSLKATSLDHAGIVHRVASLLSGKGVNIVSARTNTTPAPFSGAPVFHFRMEIDIPSSISINKLRSDLLDLGDENEIDFVLAPIR